MEGDTARLWPGVAQAPRCLLNVVNNLWVEEETSMVLNDEEHRCLFLQLCEMPFLLDKEMLRWGRNRAIALNWYLMARTHTW